MDQDALDNTPRLEPVANGTQPAAAPPSSTPLIPDHELLRCIGRGSYGAVWLARNSMGIYRAVKIVYRASFDHQRPFEREWSGIQKFEPISRLHEGFIDVLHVGMNEAQGYFYYVMELGDDVERGDKVDPDRYVPLTLDRKIKQTGRLRPNECLQFGLALSRALADLHKHDLVHRDVKPSNIIFVNGTPKLADLGLVAGLSEARSYVGTEGFIAPEGPGTAQADIYSLGKVLYEANTGKDRQDFPDLPTLLDEDQEDHDLFLNLNEAILRACKSDIAVRYQTAADLYDDLLLLTAGKSLKGLRQLRQIIATLKRASPVVGLGLLLVAIVCFVIIRERRVRADARQRQVGSSLAYGNGAMRAGDFAGSLPYFAEALRLDEHNEMLRNAHRLRLGSVIAQCPKLSHIWFTKSDAETGEISPDGSGILVAYPNTNFSAQIRSLKHPDQPPRSLAVGKSVNWATYSPKGDLAALVTEATEVSIWDAVTLKQLGPAIVDPHGIVTARFSPDGKQLVLTHKNSLAEVWDLETRKRVHVLKRHSGPLQFAAFSNNGNLIVTTGSDGSAIIWDARTGNPINSGLHHAQWVKYAAFSPDDQRVVTASTDGTAKVWDVESGRQILPDLVHDDCVFTAEFSPDGRWILTACLDGTVRLWSADKLQPLRSNPVLWEAERITQAHFSPDGRRIISTCYDGTIRIWDFAGIQDESGISRDLFSRDGTRVIVATNNEVEIHDALSGGLVSPPIRPEGIFKDARLSADGRFVLLQTSPTNPGVLTSTAVQVHETQSGKPVGPGLTITNALTDLVLAPNGRRLVVLAGKVAQCWDVGSGTLLTNITHKSRVTSAAFNPASTSVATWAGTTIRVSNPETGGDLFASLQNPAIVRHVEFSPDGSLMVGAVADQYLNKFHAQIWNAKTGESAGPLLLHGDGVLWASFSHDGRRIVTSGEDKLVAVWDTATGRRLRTVKYNTTVRMARFSTDDRWIIDLCENRTIHIWNAETGDPIIVPLECAALPETAELLPDGRHVVASLPSRDKAWIWNIPADNRPIQDLSRLARLLTAGAVVPPGDAGSSPPESLEAIWEDLTHKYPATFSISTNEIIAWHEAQAAECVAVTNLAAANFHMKCLESMDTNDPSVLHALLRIQQQLHSTNTPVARSK